MIRGGTDQEDASTLKLGEGTLITVNHFEKSKRLFLTFLKSIIRI